MPAGKYWPMPMINPKIANVQMAAAVVKPKILSEVLINAPAPRKPMPVTIAASKGRGFSRLSKDAATANAHEPMATNTNVPKLTGLWERCLSRPNNVERTKTSANLRVMIAISKGIAG